MGVFFAVVMTMVLGLLILIGGISFIRSREDNRLPASDSGRFARLESALTSLESRIDELAEQQRFLERLLADRPSPPALGSGEEPGGAREPEPPASSDMDSVLFDTEEGESTDR